MEETRENTDGIVFRLKSAFVSAVSNTFHPLTIVIWISSALLVAFAGPFGTYQKTSLLSLVGIWLILIGAAVFTAYIVSALLKEFWPDASERQYHIAFLFVGSIAIGTTVHVLLSNWLGRPPDMKPSHLQLIIYSLGVCSIVLLVRMLTPDAVRGLQGEAGGVQVTDAPSPVAEPPLPAHSRLAKRLNLPEGAKIIIVSADGHFVEVRTCSDIVRVRMRFSDAVEELDDAIGIMVHRSHWVHLASVRGWVADARKPYIVMNNDMTVPVSKTYVDKVRDAGLRELTQETLSG